MKSLIIAILLSISTSVFADTTAHEDAIGILINKLEQKQAELNAASTYADIHKALHEANQQAIVVRERAVVDSISIWNKVKVAVYPSSNVKTAVKRSGNDLNIFVTCKK